MIWQRVKMWVFSPSKQANLPNDVKANVTAKAKDIILILSNGGFEGIHKRLLQALEYRP